MPVQTAKKTIHRARQTICNHWSRQERQRRREMADLMQKRLALALQTSPAMAMSPVSAS